METSFAWSDAFLPKAVKMWKGRDVSVIILYNEESGRKSFISFFAVLQTTRCRLCECWKLIFLTYVNKVNMKLNTACVNI